MTELEAQLSAPDGPAVRRDLLQRLATLSLRLHQQLHAGVSRAEYPDWEAALDAVAAAQEVLVQRTP